MKPKPKQSPRGNSPLFNISFQNYFSLILSHFLLTSSSVISHSECSEAELIHSNTCKMKEKENGEDVLPTIPI